ncbi:MAG: YceI family protein [Chloroflexi bacterium]|nr:YceI family protein [Chloroflexota bacterium]
MALVKRRRLVIGFVLAVLGLVILILIALTQALDPGDKHDTSTDLVTPTLAVQNARLFEVSPQESRVDFTTQVNGVALDGVFPVKEGTITLEPVGSKLRVLVRLYIDVDSVDTGNPMVDRVLRVAMATGDYPLAFYVSTSRDLVPVTEEEIAFELDGDLEVHNVAHEHQMSVRAQLVGDDMWAIATSDLDLGNHDVEFPSFVNSSVIKLTAHLQAYKNENALTVTPAAE